MMLQKSLQLLIITSLLLTGCYRGQSTNRPPVHLVGDMDHQNKYKPQAASSFFSDGAASRLPVAGTVSQGTLMADSSYYFARTSQGRLIMSNPVPGTTALLERGRERFGIYCSPCHGSAGEGQGIIIKRGFIPPPSFHEDRLRQIEDGHFFEVITKGIRNMPSHAHLVSVEDRWAIAHHIRVLQQVPAGSQDMVTSSVSESQK